MIHRGFGFYFLFLIFVVTALPAHAGPQFITYEGYIEDNLGNPVNATPINFKFQILTPGSCALYEESQTISPVDGHFVAKVGNGTVTGGSASFFQSFSNTSVNLNGIGGCNYTASSSHNRKLNVIVMDGGTPNTVATLDLTTSPFSLDSDRLAGKGVNEFLKVSPTAVTSTLSDSDVSELVALLAGTSNQYTQTAANGAAEIPSFSADPGGLANGQLWYDSVAHTVKARVNGVTKSFMSSASDINSGTIGGSTAISTSGNIETTGNISGTGASSTVSAKNVTATNASLNNISVYDSDNSNKVQIQTPATGSLTTDYILTLPSDDGAAGQVLQTDGSGVLSWTTPTSLGFTPVNKAGDTMSGVLDMGSNKITSLGTPSNPQDAVTKSYSDTNVFGKNLSGTIGAPQDKKFLRWNNGSNLWELFEANINTFFDFTPTGGGGNRVRIQGPNTLGSNVTLTLPTSTGSAGQVLTTSGGEPATLSWTTPASGPTPGANGDVMYVSGGNWVSGTPDTAGLVSKTGNQNIAGIKTFSGNMGIGTTAPAAHLEVKGVDISSGTTSLRVGGASTTGLVVNNAGNVGLKTNPTGNAVTVGGAVYSENPNTVNFALGNFGGLAYGHIGNISTDKWALGAGANTASVDNLALVWTGSGSIGIGTTTPSRKLHVYDGQVGADVITDADTVQASYVATRYRSSAVPPGANFGSSIRFDLEGFTNNLAVTGAGEVATAWETSQTNDGLARDSRMSFVTMLDGAATEKMRITSDGRIGIGTSAPHSSAILDVSSTSKGFLMPRMSNAAMNAIVSPSVGLQVYNTSFNQIYFYDGGSWQALSTGSAGVTSVATGTGLTGGPITSTGTISLTNTGVGAGSYGSATQVPTFTVDAQGRLTAASNTAIAGLDTSVLTTGTLVAARMPAFTGDITTTAGSVATTLSNTGVGAGTYKSVTVDTKGRVTAGTNPTTLLGYGITDAVTSSDGRLNPNPSGNFFKIPRVNAAGLGYELRDSSQVRGDIGAAASGANSDITSLASVNSISSSTNQNILITPNGTGRVGIGTSAPQSYLHVNKTGAPGDISPIAAFDYTISGQAESATNFAFGNKIRFLNDYTGSYPGGGDKTQSAGMLISSSAKATVPNSEGGQAGLFVEAVRDQGESNAFGGLMGIGIMTGHMSSSGNPTTDWVSGIMVESEINAGTINNLVGVEVNYPKRGPGGTISSYKGLQIGGSYPAGAGTTNFTAIEISSPGAGVVTNKYGIKQLGNDLQNRFDGNVGIGVSNPFEKLEVGGNILVNAPSPYDGIRINRNSGSDKSSSIYFEQNNLPQFSLGTDIAANNLRNFYIHDEVSFQTRLLIDQSGNVGIGTTSPIYRLHSVSNTTSAAGYFSNSNSGSDSLFAYNSGAAANSWAIRAESLNGIGVRASGGTGLYGEGAAASGYGVYGLSTSVSGYGVYGQNAGGWGLYCQGAWCGGTAAWSNVSDRRLKTEINTIEDALGKVLKLNGVTYHWKDSTRDQREGEKIGFIAQEIEEVFPQAVKTDKSSNSLDGGTKMVSYSELVAPIAQAIKEFYQEFLGVKEEIQSLKQENQQLREALCEINPASKICQPGRLPASQ